MAELSILIDEHRDGVKPYFTVGIQKTKVFYRHESRYPFMLKKPALTLFVQYAT
jgi:hypothetical protein